MINISGGFDFTKGRTIYTSYTARNGTVYKTGEHITAVPASYDNPFTRVFSFSKQNQDVAGDENAEGTIRGEIRKIVAYGDKKGGYSVYFVIKEDTAPGNKLIFFEDDAVLEKIKAKAKWKSGLISREEYETLKKN